MGNKLEQILNTLIQKWWKPRWEEEIKSCQIWESFYERNFIGDTVWFYTDDRWTPQWLFTKSLREVCSKSSGLWQFVCENDLYPQYIQHRWFRDLPTNWLQIHDYRYWIIESALQDEIILKSFILDNIKVWNE